MPLPVQVGLFVGSILGFLLLAATLRKGEHLDLRLMADLVTGRIQEASGELVEAEHTLKHVADRAGAAGLHVLARRARVQLGSVLWGLGQPRQAKRLFTDGVSALRKAGDVPAAVEAVTVQARCLAEEMDPDRLYAPVSDFLDNQPAPIARLERTLARIRHQLAKDDGEPGPHAEEAGRLLEAIARNLSATDRAALRLHPWTHPVRAAGLEVLAELPHD